MTTKNVQYLREQSNTTREHFNLSEFVDYYNASNPNSVFTRDSFNLDKEHRKELVMIRIRKHASDIKLKKTGKANIQHKLLELIRSQSVMKTHNKIIKKDCSESHQQHLDNQEVLRRNTSSYPPKTARLTRSVSKKNWMNRSPVVDGKRLVLSQLLCGQNSLPRFSAKEVSKNKVSAIKTARKYQKKTEYKFGELSPWINDQDSLE